MKRREPFGRAHRVDAKRLQLLLDDAGERSRLGLGLHLVGVDQEEAEALESGNSRTNCLLADDQLGLEDAVAKRAHEAKRHGCGGANVHRHRVANGGMQHGLQRGRVSHRRNRSVVERAAQQQPRIRPLGCLRQRGREREGGRRGTPARAQ